MEIKARTKREALEHIKAEFEAGRLGASDMMGCLYEKQQADGTVKHCAVGCLFTPEQHQWIQSHGLNGNGIYSLANYVGEQNLKHMTGMGVAELGSLQREHDRYFDFKRVGVKSDSFVKCLEQELLKA